MTENKTITFFLTIDYRSNGGFSVLKEKNDWVFISRQSLFQFLWWADPLVIVHYKKLSEQQIEPIWREIRTRLLLLIFYTGKMKWRQRWGAGVCTGHIAPLSALCMSLFGFLVRSIRSNFLLKEAHVDQHSGMPNKNTHAWFV
jgi:hypothetical protein